MSSPLQNGRAGPVNSHRNYKYRRLSSVEKGSGSYYISCDEDEDEIFTSQTMELKKIGGKPKKLSNDTPVRFVSEYEQLVDRPIKSGETLRSISVKYRVPLSELKRINNIMQDNEFFALNTLKIPVKANSMLSEMLDKELQQEEGACGGVEKKSVASARAALLGTRSISSCSEYESDAEMHVGYISIDRILRDTRTKKQAKHFLDNMQKDLASIRAKTNSYKDNLDEAAAALNDLRFRPLDPSGNDGANWGLNWWKILLLGLLVLLGVPLLYIYFYFMNNNNS